MLKIDILGSCVTRDAFNIPTNVQINNYFARTSLISQYSKPLSIKLEDIQLPSAFQKRMVYWDLIKWFPKYVKNPTADFIIIDFIDERIRVLKTKDTFVTRSREFVNSGVSIKGKIITNEERLDLWKEKANSLITDLKLSYKPENIILHKAFWKTKYKGKDGLIHDFQDSEIEGNNKLLSEYYQFIQNSIPGINIIQLDEYISTEDHQWGLSPFHYEDDYYIKFIEELNQIVDSLAKS